MCVGVGWWGGGGRCVCARYSVKIHAVRSLIYLSVSVYVRDHGTILQWVLICLLVKPALSMCNRLIL